VEWSFKLKYLMGLVSGIVAATKASQVTKQLQNAKGLFQSETAIAMQGQQKLNTMTSSKNLAGLSNSSGSFATANVMNSTFENTVYGK